jgi:transcriptional regulator with XRE-family HTH domain
MTTNFGEKLKKLMKARGIKAITLAQRMNVSCAYISQLITGIRKPGRETLMKLSRALEVPMETLLMIESDVSEKIFISRRIPVLDESQLDGWDCTDLDYPSLVASTFEYASTEDPNSFFIRTKGVLSGCGIDLCDLILVEPNKEVSSGSTVFVWSPEGFSIKKFLIKDNVTILMSDKQEPIIFADDKMKEGWKFFKISHCIRKL